MRGLAKFVWGVFEKIAVGLMAFAILSLVVVPAVNNWYDDTYGPRPEVKASVTEPLVHVGSWYKQVYWKAGYHVYNFTLRNFGNAMAEEVIARLLVPGSVFAVRPEGGHLGLKVEANLVAVRVLGEEAVYDPVITGSVLDWAPLGKEFEVVQGDGSVQISFIRFEPRQSLIVLMYFKEREDLVKLPVFESNPDIVCDVRYFYGDKAKHIDRCVVDREPFGYTFRRLPNPTQNYQTEHFYIPYAYADLDPSTKNIDQTISVRIDRKVELMTVFNFSETPHYYASIAISVYGNWTREPLAFLYEGLAERQCIANFTDISPPHTLGTYLVRVIISPYDYAMDFNCTNVQGYGYDLEIVVDSGE